MSTKKCAEKAPNNQNENKNEKSQKQEMDPQADKGDARDIKQPSDIKEATSVKENRNEESQKHEMDQQAAKRGVREIKEETTPTTLVSEEPGDTEGMSTPPPVSQEELLKKLRPNSPWARRPTSRADQARRQRPSAGASRKSGAAKTQRARPSGQKSETESAKRVRNLADKKPTPEETPTVSSEVKQFSFPSYKILCGASVAPVKMFPQKVVIRRSEEKKAPHWAAGLFQNTTMSLKIRLLRLFLIWVFFRVLNKQTAWLSDTLGIGLPDEEATGPPPPKPTRPGERFIKVFHEGSPNPIHVRVRPGANPPYT